MPTSSDQQPKSLQLSEKQINAVDYIANGDHTLLVADTGEGKTAICLHTIANYINNEEISQCIVAAPASVIDHWPAENAKWGLGLKVVAVKGSPRERYISMHTGYPDVLVVSLNNLEWLLDQNPKAEMIIIDELSKAAGKQTKKLRNKKWREQLTIRVGMTATPVSESFEKLYAMMRVIDSGATFGRSVEGYMTKYFVQTDYKGYKHELREGSAELIMQKLEDILYTVTSNKRDELPPVVEHTISFDMSEPAREAYNTMKKDMLIEFAASAAVGTNQAVVSGKLRQLASGFIIDEDQHVVTLDNYRAHEVLEWARELKGAQGVILYQFEHQRKQLEQLFGGHSTAYIHGGSDKEFALTMFTHGHAQLLIAQETTISHGVDGLQHVCSDLLFMQPCWSADTRIQAIGRLDRKGQKNPVNVTTLMCNNSLDALVEQRQGSKAENMKAFLQHLKQE